MQEAKEKIYELEDLAETLRVSRNGSLMVHCHGVFDLLHIGHIRYFEEAKALGDKLIVTVTPDEYVNKGPNRPAFSQNLRLEAIASLDCVDFVSVNKWPTAHETIRLLKPNIYVKGSEYKEAIHDKNSLIAKEAKAVKAVKGKLHFTDDITFSSSTLLNQHMPQVSNEAAEFLEDFRKKYSITNINKFIDKMQDLKVLVVGETIIDEYHYCTTLGKSAKEPILASKYISKERHAGGVLAIANHIASFSKNVSLLTALGEFDSHEKFVRSSLNKKVKPHFIYKDDSPTIVKRRFVEAELLQKLFEIYEINSDMLNKKNDEKFCKKLEKIIEGFDLVVVADYGHGLISENAVKLMTKKAKFLTVNTQANAGNQGHNTISKYPKASCITLAQHEMILEYRNRHMSPEDMIKETSKKLKCKNIVLTRGKYGTICYGGRGKLCKVPAIASKIVDRVGAGDAVLSLTSMCMAIKAPLDIVGFIGNVAGAQAVSVVGNKESISKDHFLKHLQYLLK